MWKSSVLSSNCSTWPGERLIQSGSELAHSQLQGDFPLWASTVTPSTTSTSSSSEALLEALEKSSRHRIANSNGKRRTWASSGKARQGKCRWFGPVSVRLPSGHVASLLPPRQFMSSSTGINLLMPTLISYIHSFSHSFSPFHLLNLWEFKKMHSFFSSLVFTF